MLLLQNSRDEVLLREVLYDVAILVDYSFLKPEMWTRLPGDYFKKFSLTWLLVADNAVQFIRYGKMIVAKVQGFL